MKLEVKNLEKKFKNFTAVNNINFRIEEGQTLGVLGPNGCGKTTTIGMLLGLIKPSSGKILVNEETILLTESAYGQKSLSARASSKEEIVYLLDGVPINELGDPNVDISLYSSLGLSAIELVKGGHQKALSSSGTINFIPKISHFTSITYSQQFGTYNYGGYNIYGSLGNNYISINAGLNEGRSFQLYSGASAPEILTTKNQNFSNIAFKNRKNLEIRFMVQQNSKIFNNMRTKDSININIENYIMKLSHNY